MLNRNSPSRAPASDPDPLAETIDRMGAPLRAYFRKRTRSDHEAEDLTQEVFCRLAARTPDDEAMRHADAYVFQMAANLLRDRARRLGVRAAAAPSLTAGENSVEEISPERVLLGKQRLAALERALAELPERTRIIFVLHRFEDHKYSEIARRLGISVSSVEKHMMEAIRHLRARAGGN